MAEIDQILCNAIWGQIGSRNQADPVDIACEQFGGKRCGELLVQFNVRNRADLALRDLTADRQQKLSRFC